MKKYRKLLHLVHMTTYNSKIYKQVRFPLISYIYAQTYYTYASKSKKSHQTPIIHLNIIIILHMMILLHTHLQKGLPGSKYTPLRPLIIINKKILTCRPFTHTIKLSTNKDHHNIKITKAASQFHKNKELVKLTQQYMVTKAKYSRFQCEVTQTYSNFIYMQKYSVSGHGSPGKETCTQQRGVIWFTTDRYY